MIGSSMATVISRNAGHNTGRSDNRGYRRRITSRFNSIDLLCRRFVYCEIQRVGFHNMVFIIPDLNLVYNHILIFSHALLMI